MIRLVSVSCERAFIGSGACAVEKHDHRLQGGNGLVRQRTTHTHTHERSSYSQTETMLEGERILKFIEAVLRCSSRSIFERNLCYVHKVYEIISTKILSTLSTRRK